MNDVLRQALDDLLEGKSGEWTGYDDQRRTILLDMLWKMARKDWHGVADGAMDLRELHL